MRCGGDVGEMRGRCRYGAAHHLVDGGHQRAEAGRYRGDAWEVQGRYGAAHHLVDGGHQRAEAGRYRGDAWEVQGRYGAAHHLVDGGHQRAEAVVHVCELEHLEGLHHLGDVGGDVERCREM